MEEGQSLGKDWEKRSRKMRYAKQGGKVVMRCWTREDKENLGGGKGERIEKRRKNGVGSRRRKKKGMVMTVVKVVMVKVSIGDDTSRCSGIGKNQSMLVVKVLVGEMVVV